MKNDLVFIFMKKNLLKKMKVEHGAGTFYNKMIDEFAKKETKNSIDWWLYSIHL